MDPRLNLTRTLTRMLAPIRKWTEQGVPNGRRCHNRTDQTVSLPTWHCDGNRRSKNRACHPAESTVGYTATTQAHFMCVSPEAFLGSVTYGESGDLVSSSSGLRTGH